MPKKPRSKTPPRKYEPLKQDGDDASTKKRVDVHEAVGDAGKLEFEGKARAARWCGSLVRLRGRREAEGREDSLRSPAAPTHGGVLPRPNCGPPETSADDRRR